MTVPAPTKFRLRHLFPEHRAVRIEPKCPHTGADDEQSGRYDEWCLPVAILN
jgi:hypothetical protein